MATVRNLGIWRAILFTTTICSFCFPACAKYSGGTGEPNNPYQIATAEDLMLLGETPEDYDKHFILTADIDLNPNLPGRKVFDRAVIAQDTNDEKSGFQGTPFTGVFDGNGHTISHLTIAGMGDLGLFGRLESGAEVKELGLVYVNITSSGEYGDYVGSLVGWNYGVVSRCYSTGVVKGDDYIGGLLGGNSGIVICCYSTGVLRGDRFIGGLVGYNSGPIIHCYATGSVTGSGYGIGGLVGTNYGALTACYSTGAVSGGSWIGGLVGDNEAWMTHGRAICCFWDTQKSGVYSSAGGTGLTTTQMQNINTYLSAGWDWIDEIENGTSEIWQMPEGGGYPVLAIFNGYVPPELQGAGTHEDPYLISDTLDLGAMVYHSSFAHYQLAASLDLSRTRWISAVIPWFAGTLDGNGLTISHLKITGGSYLGLFGRLGSEGQVRDLGVVDIYISGSEVCVGGLVGVNIGLVANCYVDAGTVCAAGIDWNASAGGLVGGNANTIVSCYSNVSMIGNKSVGGLVGKNFERANVTNCYSGGALNGDENIGGLVGDNEGCVNYCYSTGFVRGTSVVGGFVGFNQNGSISTSYSTGTATGNGDIGGLVGSNWGDVTYCYSIGQVIGNEYVGGLVGSGDIDRVNSSVWDVETSGLSGSVGGVGLTTAQMMDPYMLALNGFGNDPNWILDSGRDYPRLVWEGVPGQMIPEPVIDWLEGAGNSEDPFLLENADQLLLLHKSSLLWNKHFVLKADINLDPNLPGRSVFGQAMIPIFKGSFVGNGHLILNLQIEGGDLLGLFGKLTQGSMVRALGLENVSVHGTASNVGGLVGHNDGYVLNCYSTGAISGKNNVGGLVGSNEGFVTECYNTSAVSGSERGVGGLVGTGSRDRVAYCFWDTQTSSQATGAGGTGLTTTQMQRASTFLDAGWDFVDETENGTEDIWWILEDQDYPKLRELPEGFRLSPFPAFSPEPQDGATEVTQPLILRWVSADPTLHHDIYFGEDKKAVANATTETPGIYRGRQPAEITTYNPGVLEFGKTYYWRIDAYDTDTVIGKGHVWSFTTADYLIVDDFESYTDDDRRDDKPIWQVWIDGFGIPDNGAMVDYWELSWSWHGPRRIHGGVQSMDIYYDNSGPAYYSEATANTADLVIGQDWTMGGVEILSLWFYGDPNNAPEPMYVALSNAKGPTAVVYHDNPNAVLIDEWTEWRIDLQAFAAQDVDLMDVDSISIGFGDKNHPQPGGTGLVFFDDIRLYRPQSVTDYIQWMLEGQDYPKLWWERIP